MAHVGARCGRGPLCYDSNLARIDRNTTLGDHATEEADEGPAVLTLGRLCVEIVVQERLKYHAHVHQVLLTRL